MCWLWRGKWVETTCLRSNTQEAVSLKHQSCNTYNNDNGHNVKKETIQRSPNEYDKVQTVLYFTFNKFPTVIHCNRKKPRIVLLWVYTYKSGIRSLITHRLGKKFLKRVS